MDAFLHGIQVTFVVAAGILVFPTLAATAILELEHLWKKEDR